MNKKKVLKYLAINELENKVFKEQKQERKRHGNKRQEGETARKADYKQHGRGIGNGRGIEERNGNRGTEREQAEERRKQGRRFFWTSSTDGAGRRMAKQTRKKRTN